MVGESVTGFPRTRHLFSNPVAERKQGSKSGAADHIRYSRSFASARGTKRQRSALSGAIVRDAALIFERTNPHKFSRLRESYLT